MNLKELFEIQRKLDERIEQEHPRQDGEDRLAKKILALQVELGELANEQRSWKFWSRDQKPRVKVLVEPDERNPNAFKNPLLEEYVDCLHFILSIGVECKWNGVEFEKTLVSGSITTQFHHLFKAISDFQQLNNYLNYKWIWGIFNGLGQMLGFTWEQIEESYMAKNKINHLRQENGY